MRTIMAEEEEKANNETTRFVMMDNVMRAKEVREKKARDDAAEKEMKEAEVRHAISDPHSTEETVFCKNHHTNYRFRPDHFKGFSKEQIKYSKTNDELHPSIRHEVG